MKMTDRITTLLAEGRIIRNEWVGVDSQGRETACLLAALSPDVAREGRANACPSEVMPKWLAHLTPWMNDRGNLAAWPGMVRRYASLAGRWRVLTDDDWNRLNYTARRVALEYSLPFAGDVADVVERVLMLLQRAETGQVIPYDDWTAAMAAADADAGVAATAAACAVACAAVWAAADVAAGAAAWAAAWAAKAAADAAADVADAITAHILDAIEATVAAREA